MNEKLADLEFGNQLQAAERALKEAIRILHQQEDDGGEFSPQNYSVFEKWTKEVAELAESVKRHF